VGINGKTMPSTPKTTNNVPSTKNNVLLKRLLTGTKTGNFQYFNYKLAASTAFISGIAFLTALSTPDFKVIILIGQPLQAPNNST